MASIRWLCVLAFSWLFPAFAVAEDFARLGQQALDRNDAAQALAYFNKAIRANSADAIGYRGRGEAYQQLDKFDLSLADLNVCLRLAPQDAVALASRARLWLRTGHNREAIVDATTSLQLDAHNAGAYGTRGLAFDRTNEFARAVADYTASIRLHPTAMKYQLRGRCYAMLGEREKAVADFKEGNSLQTASNDSQEHSPRN